MRLRITFAKTAQMRYTSHLDLYRTWERLMRRASLPLAYTQGFSPHPRINLASALPLGFTGEAEVVDIWLEKELSREEITAALQQAVPPGLEICLVETVDERAPTLQTILEASEFIITLLEPIADLEDRVSAILKAGEIHRERRGKAYDLRPLLLNLDILEKGENSCQRLACRLAAREAATGRPEELLSALDIDPLIARIHRTCLIMNDNSPERNSHQEI
jgi:radical SAM-linked protein